MSKKTIRIVVLFGIIGMVIAAVSTFRTGDAKAVAPTATPTAPAKPTPTPPPFTGQAKVVAMYPAMGEISKTNGRPVGIQVPTGNDPKKTYAVFGPGLKNVPPGVPVYLDAGAISLASGAKIKTSTWTLKSAPSGSAAKIAAVDKEVPGLTKLMASFTPDKEGDYVVTLLVTDDKGAKSQPGEIKITAAKYVGNTVCAGCHKAQAEGWAKTPHGTAFQRFVNENAEGEYFSAGFGCARCHTVGYYPVKESTGGWWDVFTNTLKLDWNKDLSQKIALNAFNEEPGKDTFSSLDPKLQAVSNIGCESCHGPAGAHVKAPSAATAPVASGDSSSCSQCHAASGHHTRGNAVMNSAHEQNASLGEGENPTCARCHSPEGFIDTVSGAKEVRAENGDLGCPVCHDPHSEENTFQLRTVGKVTVNYETKDSFVVNDAGLSALCMNCHNARRSAKIVEDPQATRFTPHASTATELIAGVGGYDFGATLKNSFHVNIGQGVINDEHSNQPGNMAFTQVNGGEKPGACVLCHMYVTPGGVWDTYSKDAKTGKESGSLVTPGHQQIGGHTFAMVATDAKTGKAVEHTEVCQQCHPGMTTFNFKATADYDGNGRVEGVQTEIAGLRATLQKAILAWKDKAGKSITLDKNGSFVTKDIQLTTEIKAAIYNLEFVNETAGPAHNFDRSVGLLQVSYKAITGKDIANATLLYTPKK